MSNSSEGDPITSWVMTCPPAVPASVDSQPSEAHDLFSLRLGDSTSPLFVQPRDTRMVEMAGLEHLLESGLAPSGCVFGLRDKKLSLSHGPRSKICYLLPKTITPKLKKFLSEDLFGSSCILGNLLSFKTTSRNNIIF